MRPSVKNNSLGDGGLSERLVLVDVDVDPAIIDNYAWHVCNENLKSLEGCLRDFHGVSGPAVRTRFQAVNAITLDRHSSNSSVRVIVYSGDPPKLKIAPNGPILIGVQIGGKLGWRVGSGQFTAEAGCSRDQFPHWLTNLLMDIYIANSSCIRPVIESIATSSISDFFTKKVSFASEISQAYADAPMSPNSGYVTLSAFQRKSDNSVWSIDTPARRAEIALRVWDNFLKKSCESHFQNLTDAADNLLVRNKIGGQLSGRSVRKKIISGVAVMVIFTPKLRQSRLLKSEAAAVFHLSAPRRNSVKFLPGTFLWEGATKGTYERRKRLISEGVIRLERYYARS